ncbi:MAG: ABC transporter, permease protein (cluster 13, osmolytes) [uncultured Rubrobacteraceae bacterium]|uniref:ABC transporter, permease protein (Cluster 13, osmolytes) n=1 Tax=uncultured Rubrobacteraceae bacterium TaxID=349277 RepID=A0A6J4Q1F6_9ACTN|nr:MAG: ABC transporter, permease protein (cluster 13, osmolytes) [uncultured Rubrobacteraceae bacterium]
MNSLLEVFQRPDFLSQLVVHVELSVVALLIGVAIALPAAIAVSRSPLASTIVINIANTGRAVPSLAILALVFPLLGFGFAPSLVALVLLAIPPILINASTGLMQVSPQVIDAARGMGLSDGQILGRIKLPIAAPVIFAGIRTSAVQVVASATLATFIGGGGLGELIVLGFQRNDLAIQIGGSLTVAMLAIITEVSFGALERTFTPKGLRIARKHRGK